MGYTAADARGSTGVNIRCVVPGEDTHPTASASFDNDDGSAVVADHSNRAPAQPVAASCGRAAVAGKGNPHGIDSRGLCHRGSFSRFVDQNTPSDAARAGTTGDQ